MNAAARDRALAAMVNQRSLSHRCAKLGLFRAAEHHERIVERLKRRCDAWILDPEIGWSQKHQA